MKLKNIPSHRLRSTVVISDMTAVLCGSAQTHLGTLVQSVAFTSSGLVRHIIEARSPLSFD
jgi:hypothetical protein